MEYFNHNRGLTLAHGFFNTAKLFPNKLAQVFDASLYNGDMNGELTWAQLQERVEAAGCGLMEMGVDKQQRIAIMAANSPYWTLADLATTCCGGVLTTIFPTLSLNEAKYIVNDSESRYLFVGSEDILERIRPGLAEMPKLEKVIMLRLDYHSDEPMVISLADLMELGRSTAAKNAPLFEARWQSVELDDWFTILYTSGTTGQGKGVVSTHKAISREMDFALDNWILAGHPVDSNSRVLCFLPLSHIFERVCSHWGAIWVGASIAYSQSAATLMNDLVTFNPTWFSCVPRLYEKVYIGIMEMLSASPVKEKMFKWAIKVGEEVMTYRTNERGMIDMRPEAVAGVKAKLPLGLKLKYTVADKLFAGVREKFGTNFVFCLSASAGIDPNLLRFFYVMGIGVLEGYGLTETASACAFNPMHSTKPGAIGPEAIGHKLRLAADGEIEVSGDPLFSFYLNKPEDTAEALYEEDGVIWFRTGDLAVIDEDGYYRIVDRKKAIICTAAGKNIAPAKIESLYGTSRTIEQIFLLGDERNFIAALVVPHFSYFVSLFDSKGIAYDSSKFKYEESNGAMVLSEVGQDFVDHPELVALIDAEIKANNKFLENFEEIKQYGILTRRFSEENGELTPTQKTKKRVVLEHYADLIEEIYARPAAH